MKRIDVMVDLETLGVKDCPPVFQIAAKAFDITTGKIIADFNELCDYRTSKSEIEEGTLSWWNAPERKDLFKELTDKGIASRLTEEDLIRKFCIWFSALGESKTVFLWGNGVNFDNRIIQNKCRQHGLKYPVFFRNDMDMRTVIEMAAMKLGYNDQIEYRKAVKFEGTAHDANDDVTNQIRDLVRAYTDLTKNPSIHIVIARGMLEQVYADASISDSVSVELVDNDSPDEYKEEAEKLKSLIESGDVKSVW